MKQNTCKWILKFAIVTGEIQNCQDFQFEIVEFKVILALSEKKSWHSTFENITFCSHDEVQSNLLDPVFLSQPGSAAARCTPLCRLP